MRPLYTFVIPCYNGSQFIEDSFHSLINSRMIEENVTHMYEIIFIDDGSKDDSTKIATSIADKWNEKIRKDFIKVITKENGQYGSVINRGLKEAKGYYFKVLDVDDTLNVTSLIKLLYVTAGFRKQVDMIITDHTFEKVGTNLKELQSLREFIEPNKILSIAKTPFPKDLVTMHSIIYRTDLLKEMNYKQIEGVYYSDSQYSLIPLNGVKMMYYLPLPLYRYYIGRDEQSINLKMMVKNREHQLHVARVIFDEIDFEKIKAKHTRDYTIIAMRRMLQWAIMLICFDSSVKNKREMINNLKQEFMDKQPKMYKSIASGPMFGFLTFTRGYFAPFLIKWGAKIYAKFKKNIMAEWD